MDVGLDAHLPLGSVFNLGGTEFTDDMASRGRVAGRYFWTPPPGFSWIVGQTVTVSATLDTTASGQPAISGTAQVGQVLTAGKGTIADIDGTAKADNGDTNYAYTYQWVRVATDSTETDITGATDSTYTLAAEDAGLTVKVKVSFTDDAGNDEGPLVSEPYPATGTIAALGGAGMTLVSNTEQTTTENVSPGANKWAMSFTTGSQAQGYTVSNITLDIASVASGYTVSNFSASIWTSVHRGLGVFLPASRLVTLDNPDSLSAGLNSFTPSSQTTLAQDTMYFVVVDDGPGSDVALKRTTSTAEDPGSAAGWSIGDKRVYVPRNNTWGLANLGSHLFQFQVNGATVSGEAVNYAATGQPAITGTAQVGQVLTAGKGTIADANGTTQADNDAVGYAYTYQWVQVATDGTETDITGATAGTYTLATEDAGKTVKVTVSFTDDADNDEGPLVSEAYPATGTIALADGNHPATGVPAITGPAQVSQVLTADLSGIADEDGTTQADNDAVGYAYTYQWVQVATDGTETDIAGATASTYTLATEDAGKTVKVTVSFTDDADFDEGPLTSEPYPATGTIAARNATIALVSNTGQPLGSTTYLLGRTGKRYAQEFRTGANAGGYHLETVGVYIDSISSSPGVSFTVQVYTAAADGSFDTREYTLRSPNSYTDSAVNVFTAPDGAVLAADTDYQIVFNARGGDVDDVLLPTTTSNAEDPGSAAGWSIDNVSRFDGNGRGPKFLISVHGSAVFESAATGQPAITGTAQVGQILTAGKGTIADENGTTKADNGDTNYAYTYQWVRVATDSTEMDITGATSKTYTLAAEDAGLTVKVKVSFTDDADNDEGPLTSEPYPATGTIALADGNHPATGVPTITGAAQVGQTLTADLSGIADEDGTTQADNGAVGYAYTYQWVQVDGSSETDIAGATSKTYTLAPADQGKTVKVKVSFTDDADFDEGPLVSEPYPATGTIALADGNHPATSQPRITGMPWVGQVLTARTGRIGDEDGKTKATNGDTGFAFTYQWVQVDGSSETDIAGATSKTYTLAAEDAGKTVKVTVSFTDDAGFDEGPLVSEAYPATGTIVVRNATRALVSNTGQPLSITTYLLGGRGKRHAQEFRTGANAGGYHLDTVGVYVEFISSSPGVSFTVQVYTAAADGSRDTREYTLMSPNSYTDSAVNVFTAPDGAVLAANTDYQIVFNARGGDDVGDVRLSTTTSNAEDPGSAAGWSIDNVSRFDGGEYSPKFLISVHGSAVVESAATGQPAITGTAQVGQTLTAGKGTIADANGTTKADNDDAGYAYTYQWVRVATDSTETDITGATSKTYTLAAEDAGLAVKVKVSFTDDADFDEGPLTSEAVPGHGHHCPGERQPPGHGGARDHRHRAGGPDPDRGPEQYRGRGRHDPGRQRRSPGIAYTYQWVQVDGSSETDITNATASTYTLAAEDAGKTVKVKVSFTDDADFDEGPLTSEPYPATGTIALADGNHPATGVPAITGMAWVGQTLTADLSGLADEDGTTQADNDAVGFAYTYQWVQVDGSRARRTSRAPRTAPTPWPRRDAGKTVKVTVSFTDDANFAEGPLTSESYPATGTVLVPPQVTASLSPAEQTVGIGQTASVTLRIVVSQAPDDVLAYRVHTKDGTADAGEDYIAVVPKLEELSLSDLTAQDDGSYVYERTYELSVLPEAGIEETFYFKIGQLYVRAHEYYATTIEGKKKGALIRISTNAATGQPTITGTARVGEVLTATKGTIADVNGTTKADNGDTNYAYTYQWVQVDDRQQRDRHHRARRSKHLHAGGGGRGADGQGQGELHRRRGQ